MRRDSFSVEVNFYYLYLFILLQISQDEKELDGWMGRWINEQVDEQIDGSGGVGKSIRPSQITVFFVVLFFWGFLSGFPASFLYIELPVILCFSKR